MGLINNSVGNGGIYRAIAFRGTEDTRVYIPGLHNQDIFGEDGTVSMEKYEPIKHMFPEIQWASIQMGELSGTGPLSCWVSFENGDIKRPILLGYLGNTLMNAAGGGVSGSSSGGGSSVPITKNIMFENSRQNTTEYLVLHTSCCPGWSSQRICDLVKSKGASVHGCIGPNGVLQTAEWTTRCGHCGCAANGLSIGVEMEEHEKIKWNTTTWVPTWDEADAEAIKSFHDSMYNMAVNLYAMLAKQFNIPKENIISHKEANMGWTTGGKSYPGWPAKEPHSDPEELWDVFVEKFGDNKYTMESFRNNVESAKSRVGTGGGSGGNITAEGATVIAKAIDWVTKVCNDDTITYSQSNRNGPKSYDCSSLVWHAYRNAGLPLSESATWSKYMKDELVKVGFEDIGIPSSVSSLKAGDVPVDVQNHVSMIVEDGGTKWVSMGTSIGLKISSGTFNFNTHNYTQLLRYTK